LYQTTNAKVNKAFKEEKSMFGTMQKSKPVLAVTLVTIAFVISSLTFAVSIKIGSAENAGSAVAVQSGGPTYDVCLQATDGIFV
jgi:hypothetical protein